MLILLNRPIVLIALCAIAYAVATLAMKTAAQSPHLALVVAIFLCLTIAVLAEIILMRNLAMDVTYIAILAAETLLVLTFSYVTGEVPTVKQVMGAVLVLGGAALVTA